MATAWASAAMARNAARYSSVTPDEMGVLPFSACVISPTGSPVHSCAQAMKSPITTTHVTVYDVVLERHRLGILETLRDVRREFRIGHRREVAGLQSQMVLRRLRLQHRVPVLDVPAPRLFLQHAWPRCSSRRRVSGCNLHMSLNTSCGGGPLAFSGAPTMTFLL